MFRPWMLSKSYALVPWPLSWFRHGYFGLKQPGLLKRLYLYGYTYISIYTYIWALGVGLEVTYVTYIYIHIQRDR